jgi:hypothetical protein
MVTWMVRPTPQNRDLGTRAADKLGDQARTAQFPLKRVNVKKKTMSPHLESPCFASHLAFSSSLISEAI